MWQAILFDIDDTLFDRNRAQIEILSLICREHAGLFVGIPENRISEAFKRSDDIATHEHEAGTLQESFRARRSKAFLHLLGLDEQHADTITRAYLEWYPRMQTPVEGAKAVVSQLATRFPLAVISNGFPDVQFTKLETLGIRHFFREITLSEQLGIAKPRPEIFLTTTAALGCEPEMCLYVGDSYECDVLGAAGAGLKSCWLNPQRVPSKSIRPDYEIQALQQLYGIVGV